MAKTVIKRVLTAFLAFVLILSGFPVGQLAPEKVGAETLVHPTTVRYIKGR